MTEKDFPILIPITDTERLRAAGINYSRSYLYKLHHYNKIPGLLIRPKGTRKVLVNISKWHELCQDAVDRQEKKKKRIDGILDGET